MPDDVSFEREKWLADLALRKEEIRLKERELRSSTWRSPLILAIFAAAVAATGNAFVAWFNARSERDLEHFKSESARILEMIKTGDTAHAVANLKFLNSSGLIKDPELSRKLDSFLATSKPGDLPVLPSDGRVGFESSASLGEQTKRSLQTLLGPYFEYLNRIGFEKPPSQVMVALEKMESPNASYSNNRIVIDPRLVDDPVVALREYNHHILMGGLGGGLPSRAFAWIESGLADYFACSFLGNPNVGETAVRAFDARRPFFRTLSNRTTLDALAPNNPVAAAGEVWGGFFWDLRSQLGAQAADLLVAASWRSLKPYDAPGGIVPAFMASLLSQANREGEKTVETVRLAAIARKIPLPERSP